MFEELAQLLNSTPERAENFYLMVKETVGRELAPGDIVAEVKAMARASELVTVGRVAKRLGAILEPVPGPVTVVREKHTGRTARRRSDPRPQRADKATGSARGGKRQAILSQIGQILGENHRRAKTEGYKSTAWDAEDFVREVRRSVSLKIGKEANILKVVQDLHRQDYLLAPHLVADKVREQFDPTG
jgi:hypothetical protein